MTELSAPVEALPAGRYIALPLQDVVELTARDVAGGDAWQGVAEMVSALLHHRYRARWQQLRRLTPDDGPVFLEQLRAVLNAANFDEIPRAALDRALQEASLFKVKLHVELDHFQELLLLRRGGTTRTARVERWKGLRHETLTYRDYAQVVLYARYRDEQWFREHDIDVAELPFTPGSAQAKLFRDVPEADLEMLVPNTEVRMRTLDKLLFGVPAVVGGVIVAVTKLAAALGLLVALTAAAIGLRDAPTDLNAGALITLLGGLVAFGSYLFRQWTKFKNRRLAFLTRLSENLYGKTVADGPGLLFTVLDGAQDQDVKEALLGYRGLLDGPRTTQELDDWVERLLPGDGGPVDFEVDDALRTLCSLGLARRDGDRWAAPAPGQALAVLRERWRELGDALSGPA